jgi:acyl carrier protein
MDFLAELNKLVKEYRDGVELKEDSNFVELGFDSLDRVELIMAVEEKLDITFPDDLQVETVAQLIDEIKKLKA